MTFPFTYKGTEYRTSIDDTLLVAFVTFGINPETGGKPLCYLRVARNPIFLKDLSENPLYKKNWFIDGLPNLPAHAFTKAELQFFKNAYETMTYSEIYDDPIFRNLIFKTTAYYVKDTRNSSNSSPDSSSEPFYREISREEWESIALLIRKL